MRSMLLVLAFALGPVAPARADLDKVERTIAKEPAYQTKSPRYLLLVFGAEAKDRAWLVQDGATLHVDRNGNGDLTDPGEKVAAEVQKDANPDESGYAFKLGDLQVGGRLHKGLLVSVSPLRRYPPTGRRDIQEVLKRDPNAMMASVQLDVESAKRKGGGLGGRVSSVAGPVDLAGPLQFSDKAATASIVQFDGPWQVSFYGGVPTLRIGRDAELILAVGTPGRGPGTFAMIEYTDTIPEAVFPIADLVLPGEPPTKERLELKQRC